jgi:hypothetical protein
MLVPLGRPIATSFELVKLQRAHRSQALLFFQPRRRHSFRFGWHELRLPDFKASNLESRCGREAPRGWEGQKIV